MIRAATIPVFFLSTALIFSFSPKTGVVPEPKGCAIIISVPMVDNDMLHKRNMLPDTLVFENLPGTVKDGENMVSILKKNGFKDENIIRLGISADKKITIKDIFDAFTAMAGKVADNDLFVFYYSGHGHQVPNLPLNDNEKDGMDEVLVTWDGYFIDDNIRSIYKKSFSKTRNIMIADACNAGSMQAIIKINKKQQRQNISSAASAWDCNITTETNVDENMNMLYYGASKDGAEAWGNKQGGYFTQSMGFLDNMYWKKHTPKELACKISVKMITMGDPGNGLIQYAELGTISKEFRTNYLFKIK